MAALDFNASSGHLTLAAATAKTVVAVVAPANQAVYVKGYKFFGDQAAGGSDGAVKTRFTTSATSGTSTAGTPEKRDGRIGTTVQSLVKTNFTVEPTTPVGISDDSFNPESGKEVIWSNPDDWYVIAPGTQFNVEFTSVAGTPTCGCQLMCEE